VIDAQEFFRYRPYFNDTNLPGYLAAQNELIQSCTAQSIPIVRIFHVAGPSEASNPFATESGYVNGIAGLVPLACAARIRYRL
jgi:hypothetical protein